MTKLSANLWMGLWVGFVVALVAGCDTKDLGKSLGFSKQDPDEFLSIELPELTIPPVAALPAPSRTTSSGDSSNAVLVSRLAASSAAANSEGLKEDIDLIKALGVYGDNPDLISIRDIIDSETRNLILLEQELLSKFSARNSVSIDSPVTITFEEN